MGLEPTTRGTASPLRSPLAFGADFLVRDLAFDFGDGQHDMFQNAKVRAKAVVEMKHVHPGGAEQFLGAEVDGQPGNDFVPDMFEVLSLKLPLSGDDLRIIRRLGVCDFV